VQRPHLHTAAPSSGFPSTLVLLSPLAAYTISSTLAICFSSQDQHRAPEHLSAAFAFVKLYILFLSSRTTADGDEPVEARVTSFLEEIFPPWQSLIERSLTGSPVRLTLPDCLTRASSSTSSPLLLSPDPGHNCPVNARRPSRLSVPPTSRPSVSSLGFSSPRGASPGGPFIRGKQECQGEGREGARPRARERRASREPRGSVRGRAGGLYWCVALHLPVIRTRTWLNSPCPFPCVSSRGFAGG
jgi:hypothetical protein